MKREVKEMQKEITVALIGNPNVGKSATFNALTGGNARVANWPGVTVEKKEGSFTFGDTKVNVVDLPGAYSLSPYSIDERIARDFILNEKPDIVVCIVDSTNLSRNLYLFLSLKELGARTILALNMVDLIGGKYSIDEKLMEELLRTPVVKTIATRGEGIDELKRKIIDYAREEAEPLSISYGDEVEQALERIINDLARVNLPYNRRFIALKLLEGDPSIVDELRRIGQEELIEKAHLEASHLETVLGSDIETYLIERRYGFIEGIVKRCVKRITTLEERLTISDRIDRVVTNKYLGIPIFALAMLIAFKLSFAVGGFFAEYIDQFFGWLGDSLASYLKHFPLLSSFVKDGLISGVGTVITFLPNIFFLFLFLSFLEDIGYMARAAFVMDRIMYAIGLPGRAFIPMLLGFGCNVPAVMATRVIPDNRERLITILINPFMSCSARLPIYVLFASAFFASHHPSLVIFSLYILGILVAIGSAKLFRQFIPSLRGKVSPLIMELPPYRMPTWKGVIIHSWMRSKLFIKKAGTIILLGVIFIWLLASLPFGAPYASSETLAGRLGHFIAPLLKPAGFGFWQAGVALLMGIIAKETVVGTLGTLFGSEEKLTTILPNFFTPLSAYAFMIMSLLYIPCIATIGAIYRETGSFRWTLFSFIWSLFVGWSISVLFYQIGRLFLL